MKTEEKIVYKHRGKGGLYYILSHDAKFKFQDTWHDAIEYQSVDGGTPYMRTKMDFNRNFDRQITQLEASKGRSPNYWQKGSQEQWEEDKGLGLLDWDGK